MNSTTASAVTSALRKAGLNIGRLSISSITHREGFVSRQAYPGGPIRIDYVAPTMGRMTVEQRQAHLQGASNLLAKRGIVAALHNWNSEDFPVWGLRIEVKS